MCGEFRAILIVFICFAALFANMVSVRSLERKDDDIG